MSGESFHVRDITAELGGFEFRDAADGLNLRGYIARFDEPTTIVDWLGEYVETIAPGAFRKTIAERGPSRIRMQFNHGHDSTFGELPIGVWTSLREDRNGLFGIGRVLDTWHTVPIRAAIEEGAVSGMSFRFRTIREEYTSATEPGELDQRRLLEVALHEAGPVVNPAYEGTSVGVRSRALELVRAALSGDGATVPVTAAGPDVGTAPIQSVAGSPDVATRKREIQRLALAALSGVQHYEQTSGSSPPAA